MDSVNRPHVQDTSQRRAAISEQEIRYFANHKDSTLARHGGLWTLTPKVAGRPSLLQSMVIGLLSLPSNRALMATLRGEYQRLGQEEELGQLPPLHSRNPRDLAAEMIKNLDAVRKVAQRDKTPKTGEMSRPATGSTQGTTAPSRQTPSMTPGLSPGHTANEHSPPEAPQQKRAQDQTRWPTETKSVQRKLSDGNIFEDTFKVIKRSHHKPLPVPPAAAAELTMNTAKEPDTDLTDFDDLIFPGGKEKPGSADDSNDPVRLHPRSPPSKN